MSELNIRETKIIPDKPNVLKNEQVEIYAPVAGYNNAGCASFDSKGFVVDTNGKVRLRRNPDRLVQSFTTDVTTGLLTIYYDDGTSSTMHMPVTTDGLYERTSLMTIINIGPDSFEQDANTGHFYCAFTKEVTGFNNDKYMVSLEVEDDELGTDGYKTVPDTVFKGEDGSLLISVDDEDDKFNGRVLLLGGEIVTDNQIVAITYNDTIGKISITSADGTVTLIDAVNEEFVRKHVNERLSSVYTFKGNATLDMLPSLEQLATGKYLGYVYNMTSKFTADIRFNSDAYGKEYPATTNVVVAQYGDEYQFDILAGTLERIDNIEAAIPLQSDYSFHYPKTYEQILTDIKTYGDNESLWRKDGDYAFWFGRFNKQNSTIAPTPGERMEVTARTSDGYVLGMCVTYIGLCTQDGFETQYSFMIDKENMFVYHNPNEIALTLYNTMAFNGVTVEEFLATDAHGNYTFRGTDGHHSIGIEFFNKEPVVGARFFGTTVLRVNEDDENPSTATFTAEVTGITNSKVDYKLLDATLIRAGDDVGVSVTYDEEAESLNVGAGDTIDSDTLVHRNYNGSITVPETPIANTDAASKKYVDTKINTKIDTKLDKDTSTTSYAQVYAKTADGTQTRIDMTSETVSDTVPLRNSKGSIKVPEAPSYDTDAASKKYVDTKLDKNTSITDHSEVYVKKADGTQTMMKANAGSLVEGFIPIRGNRGEILVPEETPSDYSATSKKYVNNKLNTKLDKATDSTDYSQVYAKDTKGAQYMVNIGRGVIENGLVQRKQNGQVRLVATPEDATDAASKNYVDTKVAGIKPDVTVSVTYDETTESLNVGSDDNVTSDVVVHRNSNGSITVPLEPSADTDAVSKKYVDNQKSMTCTYYDITGGTQTPLKGEGYYMVYSDNPDLKLCLSDGSAVVEGAKQMQFMLAIQDKYPNGAYKACGQYWTGGDDSTDIEGFRRAVDRAGYIYCPTRYTLCVMYKI